MSCSQGTQRCGLSRLGALGEQMSRLLLCRETPSLLSPRLPFRVSRTVGADVVAGGPVWAASAQALCSPRVSPKGPFLPLAFGLHALPSCGPGRRPASPAGSREKGRVPRSRPAGSLSSRSGRPGTARFSGVLGSFSFLGGSALPGRQPVTSDRVLLTQEKRDAAT